MNKDLGASATPTGLSPSVEPASSLDGSATSIPSAVERIANVLAGFDASVAKCPVKKPSWRRGGDDCPNCHAGPDRGCGLEQAGMFAALAEIRGILGVPESPAQ